MTDHEFIDRTAEQTESMITQVCKESKLWIQPNLQRPRFSFTYSFKFTYKCFVILAFHNSYEQYSDPDIQTLSDGLTKLR